MVVVQGQGPLSYRKDGVRSGFELYVAGHRGSSRDVITGDPHKNEEMFRFMEAIGPTKKYMKFAVGQKHAVPLQHPGYDAAQCLTVFYDDERF